MKIKGYIPKKILLFIKKKYFKKKGLVTKYPEYVNSNIIIENPVLFIERVSVGENVSIGCFSYVNEGRIDSEVTIGKFCSISRNVNIGGTEHPQDWLTSSPIAFTNNYFREFKETSKCVFVDKRRTFIGNDVWIGASASVKRGITVGNGAIIGTGAVVTKNVPPYAIVVGIPAKIIKYRFNEEIIQKLQEINWWDLPIDQLEDIKWNNIEEAISQIILKKIKV